MSAPVMIMAGGTGGHVFPALAVARRLQARDVPVVWLGTRAGLEAEVVPQAGLEIEWLEVRGLRGKGLGGWLRAPWMLLHAVAQAARIIARRRPRAVLGMGGYAAGPGALAARLRRVPLLIHEQNAVAGMTNRYLAPLARRVMTGFDGVLPGPRTLYTGNPVREEIAAVAPPEQRPIEPAAQPRLLVLGGSLGAQALNETVPAALARLEPALRPQVRHQAGKRTLALAEQAYREAGVEAEVVPFIADMAAAYAWADLVICRAGALTVAELAAVGVPAIFVPLPHAVDDHQTANARYLSEQGAAVLLPQHELDGARLAEELRRRLADRESLRRMAAAARRLGRPDAAEQVAQQCLEVAR